MSLYISAPINNFYNSIICQTLKKIIIIIRIIKCKYTWHIHSYPKPGEATLFKGGL